MKQYLFMKASPAPDVLPNMEGWWVSEKFDGRRFFWDGGTTRGMDKYLIPWANTAKDSRFVNRQISTGLWSTNGNVIHAPDDWIDEWMPAGLWVDGEMWVGRSKAQQQQTMSITASQKKEATWMYVKAMVFDLPINMFVTRTIDEPHFKILIKCQECEAIAGAPCMSRQATLADRYAYMEGAGVKGLVDQAVVANRAHLDILSGEILAKGGEGIVVRKPDDVWYPCRMKTMIKIKGYEDGEAIILGFTEGKGRLTGMVGALIVESINLGDRKELPPTGTRFELSGMTDDERMPGALQVGQAINYAFRTLSGSGIPVEARYRGLAH
jgi:DNA ligase-1